jgi:hypothetical protein
LSTGFKFAPEEAAAALALSKERPKYNHSYYLPLESRESFNGTKNVVCQYGYLILFGTWGRFLTGCAGLPYFEPDEEIIFMPQS